MTNVIKVKKADVWPIVRKAFPDYSGRKFRVVPALSVQFNTTNWCGGSRNQYRVVRLQDGKTLSVEVPAPWENRIEGHTVALTEGLCVVEHQIFSGHDLGVRVWVHPGNLARLLPAATAA